MKEESLLLLSDLQKLINQVVLIDYTIIILGDDNMPATRDGKAWRSQFYYEDWQGMKKSLIVEFLQLEITN